MFHVEHISILQAQDGTFYGMDANRNMVKFDQSGNIQWSVPETPPKSPPPTAA
jgi:hypothetical protein